MRRGQFRRAWTFAAVVGAGLIASGDGFSQQPPAGGGSANAPGAPGSDKTGGGNVGATIGPKYPGPGGANGSEKFAPGGANGNPNGAGPGSSGKGGGGGVGGAGLADDSGGGAGGGGMMGAGGGLGGGGAAKHDYKTPAKGAESFLSAVKTRKVEDVVQALAKRSEFEAKPENQGFFKEILHNENNMAAENVSSLASKFDGFSVLDMNTYHSSASVGVIVAKTEKNDRYTWTLTMRREKDGWKVQDYGKYTKFEPAKNAPGRGGMKKKR